MFSLLLETFFSHNFPILSKEKLSTGSKIRVTGNSNPLQKVKHSKLSSEDEVILCYVQIV